VLDIGAGRCWFTRQDPENIVALDTEPELVEHFASEGLTTMLGSAYEIPCESETFGGVFCCYLFEHLDDPARGIIEIARVLRPGGDVCLIVPSPRTLSRTFYDDFTHVRPFTKAALLALAHAGGLSRSEVEYMHWTKATGKFSRLASADATYRLYRFLDRVGRRFGLVNRDYLILHAWK
jgi:SAM-dependent methyltransferase